MHRFFRLFNINNRVYYHLLFWVCYYVYRVMLYGDIKNTFENVAYVQALEMVLKVATVYFILYFLKPRYFNKRKYFTFSLALVCTICLVSYLQLYVIWLCVKLGIFAPYTFDQVFSRWRYFSAMGHINSILFVAFIIKVVKEGFENAQINSRLLKEKLEAELQLLKSQLNPHFFFNTLNNLYALSIKKSDQAPEVVLKLSNLMSYMLYDTAHNTVVLAKELNFIQDYIELEKLRYGDYLDVKLETRGDLARVHLPPLLLLPFIENAFKHGVAKGGEQNQIHILLEQQDSKLIFNISNTKNQTAVKGSQQGGLGLKNVKRRLKLLYKKHYDLHIYDTEEKYQVMLSLDIEKLTLEGHAD